MHVHACVPWLMQDYGLIFHGLRSSWLQPYMDRDNPHALGPIGLPLRMYRNPHALGGLGLPLPWDTLQHFLSFLLLHPTGWDRKKHFWFCGHSCGCCCSHNPEDAGDGHGCDACYTAWVLTQLCRHMLQAVQSHNSPCNCRACPKSWMDQGWVCAHNRWHIIPSSWNFVNRKAHLVWGNGFELCPKWNGPWHRQNSWSSFRMLRCCLFLDRAPEDEIHQRTHRQYMYLQEHRITLREYADATGMQELLDSAGVAYGYYGPDRRPKLIPTYTSDSSDDTDSDSVSETDPVSEPEHRPPKQQLLSLWCTKAAKAAAKTMVKAKARRLA